MNTIAEQDPTVLEPSLCKQCKQQIPARARICSKCNSYQDWRSFVPLSNTALALITALVSVLGIAAPAVYKLIHTPNSEAALTMPLVDGTTLRVIAANIGDAPASLIRAWVDSDYLAAATKVRLRTDERCEPPEGGWAWGKPARLEKIPLDGER